MAYMNDWTNYDPCRRISNTDTYDGAVSQVIRLSNDDLLLFYHQSDIGHVAPDGRIVMRRSTDDGQTWSDQRTIHDEPTRDIIDPSVTYHAGSERIVLFDTAFGFAESVTSPADLETLPARKNFDTYMLSSTDMGRSWSEPTKMTTHLLGDQVIPFGGGVETEAGLLSFFYSLEHDIQALVSENGGDTWNRHIFVTDSPAGRELCEPVPCVITKDRCLLFGRDNQTGDFYAIKSTDGGMTWGEPVFFNPTEATNPRPIWVTKTGPNRLTAVWGDRDNQYISAVTTSAQLVWQDPTTIADESRQRLHEHKGSVETVSYWDGNAGDFGYPTLVQLGPSQSDILVTFYDDPPSPDIFQIRLY
jgi:hypothetical protein